MSTESKPELARAGAVHRCISHAGLNDTISVTTSEGGPFNLLPFAGQWIRLVPRTGLNATVARAAASPTLVFGEGGDYLAALVGDEFYVDPDGEMNLWHIGDASGTVDVLVGQRL
jgi:hypothetical protein